MALYLFGFAREFGGQFGGILGCFLSLPPSVLLFVIKYVQYGAVLTRQLRKRGSQRFNNATGQLLEAIKGQINKFNKTLGQILYSTCSILCSTPKC
jgi:uncharacterized protein YqgC (DUF456 family)